MKRTIKMIATLGIAVSLFSIPAYSMEKFDHDIIEVSDLQNMDPFLLVNSLTAFCDTHGLCDTCDKVPDDNQFFTQQNLALGLAIIKVCTESDKVKNKKTLKTICNAISEGIPITANHSIQLSTTKKTIDIIPCTNSTSIFILIENWFESKWFPDKDKKNSLMAAIFQGEQKKKERLAYIHDESRTHIRNKLKIDIPEDLILMFSSYLPENNVSKERTTLIQQAKQEFHKKPQWLLALLKISSLFGKTVKNITDNK